jgi:hypothetical protein
MGVGEEVELEGREVEAEESDSWYTDLVKAHDAPWAFDDAKGSCGEAGDAVEAVKDLAFRQPRRELPLTVGPSLIAVEATSGITDGMTSRIMESDADTTIQEARSIVCTGLEGTRGIGVDPLLSQEDRAGVEAEASREGAKGSFLFWLSCLRSCRGQLCLDR